MLDSVHERIPREEVLVVFVADHGESLGEHGYWGHGRNLYEPTLRIPMSITWKGQLRPSSIEAPSLIIDLAPTILDYLITASISSSPAIPIIT